MTAPTLECIDGRLALLLQGCHPIDVDFEAVIQKRLKPGVKKPMLLNACKLKPGMLVLDATAGLGRDAAILASTGAGVVMCERNAHMQRLLKDGLSRLTNTELRLSLICQDAMSYLQTLTDNTFYPDVIYCDPMHPARQKSARVKKDLAALQQLIGPDEDVNLLLETARRYAKKRVVLKWPSKQASISPPSYSLQGKTTRFDIYLTQHTD